MVPTLKNLEWAGEMLMTWKNNEQQMTNNSNNTSSNNSIIQTQIIQTSSTTVQRMQRSLSVFSRLFSKQ